MIKRLTGRKLIKTGKLSVTVAVAVLCVVTSAGCANLLEDSYVMISPLQTTPYVRPPVEVITVSDYSEFVAVLIKLITGYESEIQILYYSHEGEDVHAEIERARDEVLSTHPIGAFAVSSIEVDAARIVTHYEVDISIEYKRTKEQMDSIINITGERTLMTQLLNKMSLYVEEAVFRTNLQITDEDISEFVRETYYQNPHRIVMLPFITVEKFPEEGSDRIYVIQFGYTESPSMLLQFGELLERYIERNAEIAVGDTESELIYSLVVSLMESTSFDEGAARTIHAHGAQNLAATAFGALIRGSAVGEGFAMAFKALADKLGFDCQVVLGYYDDMVHAWNIISLYDDYYHIDVAMCVVNDIETAFLKTDADFEEMMYTWDRVNTVKCEGELTLEDILDHTDPENLNGDENQDGDPDEDD